MSNSVGAVLKRLFGALELHRQSPHLSKKGPPAFWGLSNPGNPSRTCSVPPDSSKYILSIAQTEISCSFVYFEQGQFRPVSHTVVIVAFQ